MNQRKHLPIFGVGPIYGAAIIFLSVVGIAISEKGYLNSGRVGMLRVPFLILGVLLIVFGILIWLEAVLRSKIDENIKNNHLVTTGIYAKVRNPLYSAFMIVCTGAIFCADNLWLLLLPILYWISMTVLMKATEEKWLKELYGMQYIEYCKKVNRCIPWLTK
ncbi:methyltransferase family protein [Anaerocolumna sp. MB42-C2]|uniref:methyltransferase family protein n=1 Tax=Anaerocolumna sp. MB42-C2 TaxID=3070997 RepID=UPI0027DFEB2F|nr:isoprenylcysteine carboxylmethyltransferase family protein [Anaerocolumna sp. MB42-C2]WMJ88005.1 isoprenylcysteine carboxylmethyltransferase family protein [Anaerocolumna sp. MB42-C2]